MHTIRMLHYTGPPIPLDPWDPEQGDFTPQFVYVVGWNVWHQNVEVWKPWVFCVKCNDALQLLAGMNGAQAPAMNLPYYLVMQPEFPTEPGTYPVAVLHDFKRINWKPDSPPAAEAKAKAE